MQEIRWMKLARFSKRLLQEGIPAGRYVTEFADWEKAFRAILDLPYGAERKLVILDEFPYMCRSNKSIPSILQNLWDADFKDSNVMIVLCGSAMSFIEKDLLAEKNPLYGRATGIYNKKTPFSYSAYLDMRAKLAPLQKKAKFHYALFSESGFDEKIKAEADRDDVHLYSLDEIVFQRIQKEAAGSDLPV